MKDKELRLFIAASLPSELLAVLNRNAGNYTLEGVKLVPAANLHLTLLFLGNTPADRVPFICDQLVSITIKQMPFTLSLKETSPGPSLLKPRLVWARFFKNNLFEDLNRQLVEHVNPDLKLPKEAIPHVTIARISKNTVLPRTLPVFLPSSKTDFVVKELSLWQSVLGSPHPAYSVLHTFPFGGTAR